MKGGFTKSGMKTVNEQGDLKDIEKEVKQAITHEISYHAARAKTTLIPGIPEVFHRIV